MDALRQQLSECERQLEQEVEISTRSREEAAVALARSGVRLLHPLRAQLAAAAAKAEAQAAAQAAAAKAATEEARLALQAMSGEARGTALACARQVVELRPLAQLATPFACTSPKHTLLRPLARHAA